MTNLGFRYYMKLSFSDSVEKHRFSLKCIPKSDINQKIYITHRDIYPNSFISEDTDSFGNQIIYGYEESQHKYFFFDIEGEAETGLGLHKVVQNAGTSENTFSIMKYQTEITRPGEAIKKYYNDISEDYDYENFALYVMKKLGEDFKYKSGVTDIQTTAEEAMKDGIGVCQDYAHIMLSLCRIRNIPCRYVTGMMLGEGKSHAWVEVFLNGNWVGMDPTNSQIVGEYYIKIAHGRDYRDCLVNQGVFIGNVVQRQEISINVEEIS